MVKKGDYLKVQTKTQENMFGTCVYEVMETDLKAPEKNRQSENDGVKVKLIKGDGKLANPGRILYDSQHKIQKDIEKGITEIISEDVVNSFKGTVQTNKYDADGKTYPPTGCMEID